MLRFYWLLEGAIAGCSLPGGTSTPDPRGQEAQRQDRYLAAVEADLAWLGHQGIGAILSLTEQPLPAGALERRGLQSLHLPVPDLTAPLPHQFCAALDAIDLWRSQGRGVAVHCLQGQGRTGSILAAYLIRSGMPVSDAVQRLRTICPGALSTPSQEHALAAFCDRRDWVI